MSTQVYVQCPHCAGTGTLPQHLGGGECRACDVVRVVSVQQLLTSARILAGELGRARHRLASLDGAAKESAGESEQPRKAGGSCPPLAEQTPDELRQQAQEYRQWASDKNLPEGA